MPSAPFDYEGSCMFSRLRSKMIGSVKKEAMKSHSLYHSSTPKKVCMGFLKIKLKVGACSTQSTTVPCCDGRTFDGTFGYNALWVIRK